MLPHELVWRREHAGRFRHGARAIHRIAHPGVVQVFGAKDVYATISIVMELVAGHDLIQRVVEVMQTPALSTRWRS